MFQMNICRSSCNHGMPYTEHDLSGMERMKIMMLNGKDFHEMAGEMSIRHPVHLCLTRIALTINSAKSNTKKRYGSHNLVLVSIRGSALCKFASALKVGSLDLASCFLGQESESQKTNVLVGTRMQTCFFRRMFGSIHKWVEKTPKTPTKNLIRYVLLANNLTAQVQDFKKAVSNCTRVV